MMSMTGYGRASATAEGRTLTVEIRSVNHRFLDISLRLPKALSFLEDDARKLMGETITRGHLDVTLSYQNLRSDARTVEVDEALAGQYEAAIKKLNAKLGLKAETSLEQIASYPDVLIVTQADEDEDALKVLLRDALGTAINNLVIMRKSEGARMKEALLTILDEVEQKSLIIDQRYPETVKEYSKRLSDRLSELSRSGIDPARLAQEVAIMADKAAVDEETVRLRSHIEHARALCREDKPVGRSLDFLVQEMNREVNTISSKSQDIPITEACLSCKSAIEKLREQLQNVE